MTANGSDPCQLYQLLKDADGNSVAEISLFDLPEGGQAAAGATFMAPLETLLTANLRIGVDSGQPRIYPFAFCTQSGCVARLGFTAEEVAAFKKGIKAVLTIVPAAAPDQEVVLDMTLKGFTAGFAAVTTANAGFSASTASLKFDASDSFGGIFRNPFQGSIRQQTIENSWEQNPSVQAPLIGGCEENGSCYGDISTLTGRPKTVQVDGYYRNDGTYVRGHYRSKPRN